MPSAICVARWNYHDYNGPINHLTTINKYQTLYFSFMEIRLGKNSLPDSLATPDLQNLIRISKGARCVRIESFDMGQKDPFFIHLASQLVGCDKLEILKIPHITGIFHVAVATMKSLRELSCITVTLDVFDAIPETLESLQINSVTDNSVEIAQSLKRLTSLRHVNIYFSHMDEENQCCFDDKSVTLLQIRNAGSQSMEGAFKQTSWSCQTLVT